MLDPIICKIFIHVFTAVTVVYIIAILLNLITYDFRCPVSAFLIRIVYICVISYIVAIIMRVLYVVYWKISW